MNRMSKLGFYQRWKNAEWYKNYLRKKEERARQERWQAKREIVSHYTQGTNACANPFGQHEKPYTDIRTLTIDHINGGGSKHKRELKVKKAPLHGNYLYAWLIENNYPDGFQILCFNCQRIKQIENHQFRKN